MFLRDVAWGTTDASLREAMRAFGDVVEANVVRDRNTGKSKVTMMRLSGFGGGARCIHLDGHLLHELATIITDWPTNIKYLPNPPTKKY